MKFKDGVDKDIGKFEMIGEDAFITPFLTKEYCSYLISLFEDYGFKLDDNENCDILMHRIKGGKDICKSYLKYVEKYIEPKILKVFKPVIKTDHIDGGTVTHPGTRYRGLWAGYPVPFCKKWSNTEEGQTKLRLHNDNSLLTLFMILNDDYGGCETVFPRQNWDTSKLKAGHVGIFPGTITHPHFTKSLKSGVKYTLVGRVSILQPRNGEFDNIKKLFLYDNIV